MSDIDAAILSPGPGGPLGHPEIIGRGTARRSRGLRRPPQGSLITPFVDLRVSVGEGQRPGAVVVAGRAVVHRFVPGQLGGVYRHQVDEESVVDRRAFIGEDPAVGRVVDLVNVAVFAPDPFPLLNLRPGGAAPETAEEGIHGDAADPGCLTRRVERPVAGAFEETS